MKAIIFLLAVLLCGEASAGKGAGGLKTFTLGSGGRLRVYGVYAPPQLERSRKYPLLVILHGSGGTGKNFPRLTRRGFEKLADANGAILAYPEGVDKGWNDYRADKEQKAQRENIDDASFIVSMLDELAGSYPVDTRRVYAAGISNGAMMTYALACRAAGRFAAIAPVDGAMPENLALTCKPSRPVPVLIMNGTADKLVRWEGGDVTGLLSRRRRGRVLSAEKSRDFWLANNSCDAAKKEISTLDSQPEDGTSVEKETYSSCAGGANVELIKITGGGHTWPGGRQYLPEFLVGRTSAEFDASREIWDFFMKQ